MDSGDLEREKGITILAKNTAIRYSGPAAAANGEPDGITINVIDTPGHADFGGEVERGLSMVDGVVLLVDASEGPLPQTRFVLRKALAAKLPVIVVVNKVDRPTHASPRSSPRPPTCCSAWPATCRTRSRTSTWTPSSTSPSCTRRRRPAAPPPSSPPTAACPPARTSSRCSRPSSRRSPAPTYEEDMPLQAHVTNLDASPFLGRLALLRIYNGTLTKGQNVAWARHDGTLQSVKITELLETKALDRVPTDKAGPGEIVAVAGIADIMIGETLTDIDDPRPLPLITVDDPAISMTIGINTAPARGQGRQGPQGHRPPGEGPPRLRARRQRVAQGAPDRASRRVGGAGPWRAGPGHPRRADASRGLRAHGRQAAGRHQADQRQAATSRWST